MSDCPIYDELAREHAAIEARQIVRAGLRMYVTERPARVSDTRLRILNQSPLLYAVTSGA